MPRTVTIRATALVAGRNVAADDAGRPTLSWEFDIGNRYGRARVVIVDLAFVPGVDDFFQVTRTNGTTRDFAGLVSDPVAADALGQGDRDRHTIDALGFGSVLDRIRLGAESWAAGTPDRKMVQDLLDSYYGPIGTGLTHSLRSRRADMPAITLAAGITLRSALDAIAAAAFDAPWWVDANKILHWNDRTVAAYVLHAPSTTSADWKEADDADFAALEWLADRTSGAMRALRVRVVGAGAVEATATDRVGLARVLRRDGDEFGAPAERFWQAPDVTDTSLTTSDEVTRRAYTRLAETAPTRRLEASTSREGFAGGELVDVVNRAWGTRTVPNPRWSGQTGWRTHTGKRLDRGLGRFRITSLRATMIGAAEVRYDLGLGAYEAGFPVVNVRGAR